MRRGLLWVAMAMVSGGTYATDVYAEDKKISLVRLPKSVSTTVDKMYPKAKIVEFCRGVGREEAVYEVTVNDKGHKVDITVDPQGHVEHLEREISFGKLPDAVLETLVNKYATTLPESAEAVYHRQERDDDLEFYQVRLETLDLRTLEVKVKPNGEVLGHEFIKKPSHRS